MIYVFIFARYNLEVEKIKNIVKIQLDKQKINYDEKY